MAPEDDEPDIPQPEEGDPPEADVGNLGATPDLSEGGYGGAWRVPLEPPNLSPGELRPPDVPPPNLSPGELRPPDVPPSPEPSGDQGNLIPRDMYDLKPPGDRNPLGNIPPGLPIPGAEGWYWRPDYSPSQSRAGVTFVYKPQNPEPSGDQDSEPSGDQDSEPSGDQDSEPSGDQDSRSGNQ